MTETAERTKISKFTERVVQAVEGLFPRRKPVDEWRVRNEKQVIDKGGLEIALKEEGVKLDVPEIK
jgi:hypothetical protein